MARTYDHLAWTYDLWASWADFVIRKMILEMAAVRQAETLLEIGMGTGLLLRDIERLSPSHHFVGVDLSYQMLRRAQRRSRRACHLLLISDARRLPFKAQSFDVLLSTYMLDTAPLVDLQTMLLEFRRVLKPHGRVVTATLAESENLLSRLWRWMGHRCPALVGGSRPIDLAPHFIDAGFVIREERFLPENSWDLATQFIHAGLDEPFPVRTDGP